MNDVSRVILLRHGEPDDGDNLSSKKPSQKIFRGITDDPLTDKGWQQMSDTLENIENIEQVFTSPLIRCSEFANKFSMDNALPLDVIDALKEINFGEWEGQLVQKISENQNEQLKQFWENPMEYTPPCGEPVIDFQKRVITFWHKFLTEQRNKTTLIVLHGGVQKMILAEVLKMPVQAIHNIEVPYACCSIIQVYYNGSEYLTTLKSHSHLKIKS